MGYLTETLHLCNMDMTPITLCGQYIDEKDDTYYTFDKGEFINNAFCCKACYNKLNENANE